MNFREQRRRPRNPATQEAVISFVGDSKRHLACIIVDLSDAGARLKCKGASDLPDQLMVTIPGSGGIRKAEVRWRKDDAIGVEFVETDQAIAS